jgi:CheY-like chemotaxis protein
LKRIPTLILSSSNRPDDISRGYELGCHAYLVKPISSAALEHMVNRTAEYWLLREYEANHLASE